MSQSALSGLCVIVCSLVLKASGSGGQTTGKPEEILMAPLPLGFETEEILNRYSIFHPMVSNNCQ